MSSAFLIVSINGLRPLEPSLRISIADAERVELRCGRRRSVTRSLDKRVVAVRIVDRTMAGLHAFLARDEGGFRLWDCGKASPVLLNGHPHSGQTRLRDGDLIATGSTFFLFRTASYERPRAPVVSASAADSQTLSPAQSAAFARAKQLARSSSSVVIEAPMGCRRSELAAWMHSASGRPGPLVRLPAFRVLDELELVRRAHRGTLFLCGLERLGDQAREVLLSVLDGSQVQAPASTELDVRVLASAEIGTRAALDKPARNIIAHSLIRLPSLSERREDLGLLIARELAAANGIRPPTLSPDAIAALLSHDWPGNLAELASAIRHAAEIASAERGRIELAHLPQQIRRAGQGDPTEPLRARSCR